MIKPDITLHGIRFYYNEDSESYSAQVDMDDIEEVSQEGYNKGYDNGANDSFD